MKLIKLCVFCLLLWSLPFINLSAQSNADFLKYRQDLMKSNGMNMGMIGQIMKSKLPFQIHIETLAGAIAGNNRLLEEAYKKRITSGRTDSKPAVWQQWSKFAAAANKSAEAAVDLALIADSNPSAIMPAMQNLGKTCGGCHRNFRKPKNERFKR